MIYLDYSATTPCAPQVLAAMAPYFRDRFGNPSSSHAFGREAKAAVEKARLQLAEFVGCGPGEIVFTSGATESNNLIFLSLLLDAKEKRRKIAVSAIEHKSVLLPAKNLGTRGFDLTLLPVTSNGIVDINIARKLITEDTALVSVHTANNEIGTIQPVKELAEIAHRVGAKFHTDAAQALGKMPFDAQQLDCDLASFSSHKIYGPKGIGALYIRGGSRKWPWDYPLYGGGQESGIRPGTYNVPAIVGFGEAAVLIRQQENDYLSKLQMVTSLCSNIIQSSYPKARIIGEGERKLFGILCFLIPYIQADALSTSSSSICVSHGSACNSGTLGISHVIQNLGLTEQEAVSTFRVSLSADTTEDDLIMLQKELSHYVDEGMGTI